MYYLIKRYLFLMVAIVTLSSCQKEENHHEQTSLDIVKSLSNIDIDTIEETTDAELNAIFNEYEETLQLDTLEITESKTVNYNGLTGKSVVIDYQQTDASIENSLIFILSENNNVDTYLMYNISWDDQIGYVNVLQKMRIL